LYGRIKRFIHVSTDEVYGETSHGTGKASGEQATLEPTNPYSATKAAAEMLVKVRRQLCTVQIYCKFTDEFACLQAYYTSYQLPCIITRGNNVYGPHQYPEKLIPKFILLASSGASLPVHGAGASLRSFL
jgi:UDP-glucose 4,6-dehydratase